MIKAYVVGISTHQEGEDIEVRYSIHKNGEMIAQKKKYQNYKKPSLVTHFALLALLKDLKNYSEEDTKVIMYDSAVNEQLRGTSTTKNKEALRLAKKVNEELLKFNYSVEISDVTGDNKEILAWNKVLEF